MSYVPKLRYVLLAPPDECIDWPSIIYAILRSGISKRCIADNCNTSRETIYGILNGNTEPRWSQGQQLLKLRNLCKETL